MASATPHSSVDLLGLSLEQLTTFLVEDLGERPFHARQLYRWIHQRGATDFEEMTDLSKALRAKLAARCALEPLAKDLEQRCTDGTIKYRFSTRDGRVHRVASTCPRHGPKDALRLHPGRLRDGLHVLHDRHPGAAAEPHRRGDRRPGARGEPGGAPATSGLDLHRR